MLADGSYSCWFVIYAYFTQFEPAMMEMMRMLFALDEKMIICLVQNVQIHFHQQIFLHYSRMQIQIVHSFDLWIC